MDLELCKFLTKHSESISTNNYCINGECSKCGRCCSNFLPLSEREIRYLKKIVRKRNLKPYFRPMLANPEVVCPFLDNSNHCSIYSDRPDICKAFKCDYQEKSESERFTYQMQDYKELVDVREEIFNGL